MIWLWCKMYERSLGDDEQYCNIAKVDTMDFMHIVRELVKRNWKHYNWRLFCACCSRNPTQWWLIKSIFYAIFFHWLSLIIFFWMNNLIGVFFIDVPIFQIIFFHEHFSRLIFMLAINFVLVKNNFCCLCFRWIFFMTNFWCSFLW